MKPTKTASTIKAEIRELRIKLHQAERDLMTVPNDQDTALVAQLLPYELAKQWAPWSQYLSFAYAWSDSGPVPARR